jgi:hypothetical protein
MSEQGQLPPWKGGPAHASGWFPYWPDGPVPTVLPAALPQWQFENAPGDGEPYPPDRPDPNDLRTAPAASLEWNAMSDLVLDGRMVEFNSEAGPYQAAATYSEIVLEEETMAMGKHWGVLPDGTTGYEPDARYIPTGWRELIHAEAHQPSP